MGDLGRVRVSTQCACFHTQVTRLPSLLLPTKPQASTAETTDLNEVERQSIGHVMRETRGNKSRAAKRLGLSRTQLYGRLRKYGLNSADL
jgi:DNA-binding NtrC family response regulator